MSGSTAEAKGLHWAHRDQLGFNDVPIKRILRAQRREDPEAPAPKTKAQPKDGKPKADGAGLWTDV